MILELNAQTLVEETRREDERLTMNTEFTMRWWFTMIQLAASVRGSMLGRRTTAKLGRRARLSTASRRVISILNLVAFHSNV
jgi:hypothetical protein